LLVSAKRNQVKQTHGAQENATEAIAIVDATRNAALNALAMAAALKEFLFEQLQQKET